MDKRLFERPDLYFKFRVWDKYKKEMRYLSSSSAICDLWALDRIPMMFTGIYDSSNVDKDKCKPIYEGDILKRIDTGGLGIVKYITHKARFEVIWLFETYVINESFGEIIVRLIKVGNVFENGGEMLKDIVGWKNIFME